MQLQITGEMRAIEAGGIMSFLSEVNKDSTEHTWEAVVVGVDGEGVMLEMTRVNGVHEVTHMFLPFMALSDVMRKQLGLGVVVWVDHSADKSRELVTFHVRIPVYANQA